MNAKELRIGNLLQNKKGEVIEIENLSEYGLNGYSWSDSHHGVQSGGFEYDYKLDELSPIILTEEWLLKLGFVQAPIYPRTWNKNGVSFWFYSERPSVMLHQCKPDEFNYRSVHQVQNIYYALTGEELSESVGTK